MRSTTNIHIIREVLSQLFPALIATLSSVSDGMQYGWSAPVLPVLRSEKSPVKIEKIDEFWLETCYLISALAGFPITIYLVNAIGRRKTIMVASCTTLTSWIIMAMATERKHLYVARVMTGVAGDVSYISTPMYLTEIAGQHIRGFLAGLDYLMMMVGILIIYSVAPYAPYYVPETIGAALLTTQLIILPFMPESPYYLMRKGKFTEAKRSLRRLRNREENDKEFEDIAKAIESQASQTGRYKDLVLLKSNRKALVIIAVLIACQHFSAFNIILMNLHTILKQADSVFLKPEETGIMFAALMVIATAICSMTVDIFGRKVLLSLSGILTGICLMLIAIYFTLKYSNTDLRNLNWIVVAAVMFYAISFKLGLGLVPQLLISEIMPTNIKAVGLAFGDFLYVTLGIAALSFYHYVGQNYGVNVPFFLFSAVAFSSVIFTAFVIPETKGKSLWEIQSMLRGENLAAATLDDVNVEGKY